jgi:hypothetical protein
VPRWRHDAAAGATDIRIASEHAAFDLAQVKRGILPGNDGGMDVSSPLVIGLNKSGDSSMLSRGNNSLREWQ